MAATQAMRHVRILNADESFPMFRWNGDSLGPGADVQFFIDMADVSNTVAYVIFSFSKKFRDKESAAIFSAWECCHRSSQGQKRAPARLTNFCRQKK